MSTSNLLGPLQAALDFVHARPWLNGSIKFVVLLVILYVAYRFLMSPKRNSLREKFPFLRKFYGSQEIRELIRAGEFAQAGENLAALGQLDQAIEVFIQGNLYGRAADIYLRRKQMEKAALAYEKAGDHLKAAEIYLQRKQYDRVESALTRADKLEELGKLYEQAGEKALAAQAYLKANQWQNAGKLFSELDRPLDAAEAFKNAYEAAVVERGDSEAPSVRSEIDQLGIKAARHFEGGAKFEKAAELFLKFSKISDAARCFEKLGNYPKAAELYEQTGDLDSAAQALAKSGDTQSAARLEAERLEQSGETLAAIAKFQEAQDFLRAAELYRDLHDLEKAAAMCERGRDFVMAGGIWRELGRFEDAGRAYERAKEWSQAIDCYGLAKIPAKQVSLLEKTGDFLGMASVLYTQELPNEAIAALDRIPRDSPSYRGALALKGRIFLDQGAPLKAKELFEHSLKLTNRLSGPDVDTLYNLAVASDEAQSESTALQTLEKMLAQDLVEKDAVDKANNVRKLLSERAFTKLSRMAAISSGGNLFAKSDAAIAAQDVTTPKKIRYIRVKEIGRGGMGIVYTAKDSVLDRTVALKILPSSLKQNEQAVKTFLREAKAAGGLNHANIVTVHDAGMQEGDYYIAMELIEGKTIKEIIRSKGKLSLSSVLEVLKQLFAALAYAHSKNVVHRDLTTNNIMWTKQKTIKIMDFGLAKIVKELHSEQSIVGGTPSFMSPEQTLGKPIDHRTDIYSLGICIYEMLLGELPFTKGDLGFHHVHTAPPIPKEKDPAMPDILNRMILRCMEKEPENRFQNIAEMQAELGKMS